MTSNLILMAIGIAIQWVAIAVLFSRLGGPTVVTKRKPMPITVWCLMVFGIAVFLFGFLSGVFDALA